MVSPRRAPPHNTFPPHQPDNNVLGLMNRLDSEPANANVGQDIHVSGAGGRCPGVPLSHGSAVGNRLVPTTMAEEVVHLADPGPNSSFLSLGAVGSQCDPRNPKDSTAHIDQEREWTLGRAPSSRSTARRNGR